MIPEYTYQLSNMETKQGEKQEQNNKPHLKKEVGGMRKYKDGKIKVNNLKVIYPNKRIKRLQ